MTAQCASDEQYFPVHDLGGPLWERQEIWDKWDPSRFTANWATPQLVIHSSLDYRLTVAEGLAAFNVLQMRGVESLFLNFPDEKVSLPNLHGGECVLIGIVMGILVYSRPYLLTVALCSESMHCL